MDSREARVEAAIQRQVPGRKNGAGRPLRPDQRRKSEEGSKRTPGGWDAVMLPQQITQGGGLGLPARQVRGP